MSPKRKPVFSGNSAEIWDGFLLLVFGGMTFSCILVSLLFLAYSEAIGAYTFAVKGLACRILEKVAEELKIEPRDTFSQYLTDKQSDSVFRLNHYPPSPTLVDPKYKLIGFGEHTDPQILTVLRSNGTAGLEICLRDGSWLPVPPDPNSLVINVGDAMQVQIQVSLPDEL